MGESVFYYETHIVTSGPSSRLRDFGFWSSVLEMDDSHEEKAGDTIWTTRDHSVETAKMRLKEVLSSLTAHGLVLPSENEATPGLVIERYKIEACVLDSKRDDAFYRLRRAQAAT